MKIVEVIEPKVSAEEIAKARELQLPDNFYAYKQRPACKGCPGCDKEDSPEPKPVKENRFNSNALSWCLYSTNVFLALLRSPQSLVPPRLVLPVKSLLLKVLPLPATSISNCQQTTRPALPALRRIM